MKHLYDIGLGECCSCGAMAIDVAKYKEFDSEIERQCCRMCAYKEPWKYNHIVRTMMETLLYVANIIRMDIRNE